MKSNWQTKKLSDLCETFTDGNWIEKKDQSSGGIRLIQTGNIGNGVFRNRSNKARYISEETFKRLRCTEVLPNDLLISRLPDPVGRSSIVPETGEKMITAVDCTIIRFKKEIDSRWFVYFTLSNEYNDQIRSKITGATRQRISRKNLGAIEIFYPSINEQRRIVKQLDDIFEKTTMARGNVEKNLQNSKELFESYLQSIFENPGKDWEDALLSSVTSKIGSGATPLGGKKSYKKIGMSLVRSMNVHDRNFIDKNLALIDDRQAEGLKNATLQKKDILLNITGASVARSCVLPDKYLPGRVNQHVSIIRPLREIIDSIFLNYLLTSQFYKSKLLFFGERGATRQAITKSQLEELGVSFPESIIEQKAIVKKLDRLSSETKKLEKIYEQKLADLEEFKKSVLRKAFKAEL